MKESKKWTNHKKEGKTSNTSSEKNKTNSRKETRGLHGSLPRRLKKMFFFFFRNVARNRAGIEAKKIQILSTRCKKKRKRKTQPWNLNPKGRTPPFRRLTKLLHVSFWNFPTEQNTQNPERNTWNFFGSKFLASSFGLELRTWTSRFKTLSFTFCVEVWKVYFLKLFRLSFLQKFFEFEIKNCKNLEKATIHIFWLKVTSFPKQNYNANLYAKFKHGRVVLLKLPRSQFWFWTLNLDSQRSKVQNFKLEHGITQTFLVNCLKFWVRT